MTRGETIQSKVHFKGSDDDFLVFVDDKEEFQKWKDGDRTIPLAQVVSSFKVFVTHKQGAQGNLDGASHATLDNEFGTHDEEEVVKLILEKGTIQDSEMPARQGSKNDAQGARVAH